MTTLTTPAKLDQGRPEAFAERIVETYNQAALALMISLGHRSGLFDTLAGQDPATSEEIAERSGLNERYVREWLGAMVTGRVVEYDPTTLTYQLPAEHAAWLTRAATPNNLAVTAQFFPILASVEDEVLDSFRNGGGVPYCQYTRFHEVMADESAQSVVAALIDSILPLAPGVRDRLEQGIDVLDVGCGGGRALCTLAEQFPKSRFVGYDLCEDAIQLARAEAEARGLGNVRFESRDVTDFSLEERFDLITAFDAIHDQKDPAAVLNGIYRSLEPDGTFLMQDIAASSYLEKNIDHPLGPFFYTISCMHCMTVSLAQGGAGLGTAWGEELAIEMLNEAGFRKVTVQRLDHDIQNNYYVMKKAG